VIQEDCAEPHEYVGYVFLSISNTVNI